MRSINVCRLEEEPAPAVEEESDSDEEDEERTKYGHGIVEIHVLLSLKGVGSHLALNVNSHALCPLHAFRARHRRQNPTSRIISRDVRVSLQVDLPWALNELGE